MASNKNKSSKIDARTRVPDEMWLKVFQYLPFESLQTSMQVCKKWNKIIADSPQFIAKTMLHIHIQGEEGELFDANSFTIEKCYDSVAFFCQDEPRTTMEYRQFLTQLGKTAYCLRSVFFKNCDFIGADFIDFLRQCTKLEKLEIPQCRFVRSFDTVASVELKLQEFRLEDSNAADDWILDFINCRKVTGQLGFSRDAVNRCNSDAIVRFLNKIEGEVGVLIVHEIDLDQSFVDLNPKFGWNELELKAKYVETMFNATMQNKQILYDSAAPNATRLQFEFDYYGVPAIYDIIAKTKSVKSLHISEDLFLKLSLPYDTLPTLDHIESLSLLRSSNKNHYYNNPDEISPFLELFLNKLVTLKSLKMGGYLAHYLQPTRNIQPFQRELTILDLWLYDERLFTLADGGIDAIENLSQLEFPKLQKLIMHGDAANGFMSVKFSQFAAALSRNCPRLREVKIYIGPVRIYEHHQLETIALYVYAAMTTVELFEFDLGPSRSWENFSATRDEMKEKFFGDDAKICQTVAMLHGAGQQR